MDALPPYLVHQILKRTSFEDRLLTMQRINTDWRRWAPMDDLRTLKVSQFEKMRTDSSTRRGLSPSSEYFRANQEWLRSMLVDVITRAGGKLESIEFDSTWPRINDIPPLFCSPDGFKRWTLDRPLLELIQSNCGHRLQALKMIEENFVYTELAPEAYPLLTAGHFPRLRRLAVARVDSAFGPYLRQLSLTSLAISGEQAPMDTAEPDALKSLHVSHPFPEQYGNHANFYLSRHFPNLEDHSEKLLVEFDQLNEQSQQKRLADYRQLPNFGRFRIQLGAENAVRTELSSIAGYGLPKLRGSVNLRVQQLGDLAANGRFLGGLRHVRVEGTLGYEDAVALLTNMPDLEHLTLACHWLTDEEYQQQLAATATGQDDDDGEEPPTGELKPPELKANLSRLRNFRLTLWERAPRWLRPLLISVFESAGDKLRSFRLQDFSDEDQVEISLLDEIDLNRVSANLKRLNLRLGTTPATSRSHLATMLRVRWPRLSTFTWHAARFRFDQQLVAEMARSFPALVRFHLVPPSGPLRPLLPGNDADDGLCQFDSSPLAELISSLDRLEEIRLYATTSSLDSNLARAISSHTNLKTVKIWDSELIDEKSFEAFLHGLDRSDDDLAPMVDGRRKRARFVEVFTLRSSNNEASVRREHQFDNGNGYFMANGRSNAIDEQIFYFP